MSHEREVKRRRKKTLQIHSDLFNDLNDKNSQVQGAEKVFTRWAELDAKEAMKEMLDLIFEVAGFPHDIVRLDDDDDDKAIELLMDEILASSDTRMRANGMQYSDEYPLAAGLKSDLQKKYHSVIRRGFMLLWSSLSKSTRFGGSTRLQKIENDARFVTWLVTGSSSKLRAVRHAFTCASVSLVAGLEASDQLSNITERLISGVLLTRRRDVSELIRFEVFDGLFGSSKAVANNLSWWISQPRFSTLWLDGAEDIFVENRIVTFNLASLLVTQSGQDHSDSRSPEEESLWTESNPLAQRLIDVCVAHLEDSCSDVRMRAAEMLLVAAKNNDTLISTTALDKIVEALFQEDDDEKLGQTLFQVIEHALFEKGISLLKPANAHKDLGVHLRALLEFLVEFAHPFLGSQLDNFVGAILPKSDLLKNHLPFMATLFIRPLSSESEVGESQWFTEPYRLALLKLMLASARVHRKQKNLEPIQQISGDLGRLLNCVRGHSDEATALCLEFCQEIFRSASLKEDSVAKTLPEISSQISRLAAASGNIDVVQRSMALVALLEEQGDAATKKDAQKFWKNLFMSIKHQLRVASNDFLVEQRQDGATASGSMDSAISLIQRLTAAAKVVEFNPFDEDIQVIDAACSFCELREAYERDKVRIYVERNLVAKDLDRQPPKPSDLMITASIDLLVSAYQHWLAGAEQALSLNGSAADTVEMALECHNAILTTISSLLNSLVKKTESEEKERETSLATKIACAILQLEAIATNSPLLPVLLSTHYDSKAVNHLKEMNMLVDQVIECCSELIEILAERKDGAGREEFHSILKALTEVPCHALWSSSLGRICLRYIDSPIPEIKEIAELFFARLAMLDIQTMSIAIGDQTDLQKGTSRSSLLHQIEAVCQEEGALAIMARKFSPFFGRHFLGFLGSNLKEHFVQAVLVQGLEAQQAEQYFHELLPALFLRKGFRMLQIKKSELAEKRLTEVVDDFKMSATPAARKCALQLISKVC